MGARRRRRGESGGKMNSARTCSDRGARSIGRGGVRETAGELALLAGGADGVGVERAAVGADYCKSTKVSNFPRSQA